jgi:molecular chaperone DnaK (HSP70)
MMIDGWTAGPIYLVSIILYCSVSMTGVDFATTLSRDKFEDLIRPLLTRAIAPIKELFTRDSSALADVTTFELYGGGVRVPALQALITAEWPVFASNGGGLGKHVDGDESAVFGAGLYAANLNSVAGTKKIEIEDNTVNSYVLCRVHPLRCASH